MKRSPVKVYVDNGLIKMDFQIPTQIIGFGIDDAKEFATILINLIERLEINEEHFNSRH